MEIGIDSFASETLEIIKKNELSNEDAMHQLLERIQFADRSGVDVFGIGEHHREGFLDSAPTHILAAAAAVTERIRLTSAVTVLSAADPVRIFQHFATLDLISKGRAEIVVGRGSSVEAFPLFGYDLRDYDELFEEKIGLLLKIRENKFVTWSGKFRAPLHNLSVLPRPSQDPLPIWIGVGGTPESFIRAGRLGLPLVVAVIGGHTHRFRPLVDLYREAGDKAGFSQDRLKVSLHSPGYLAETHEKAVNDYTPGSFKFRNIFGKERGWPPSTWESYLTNTGPKGSFLLGSPDEVAEKIERHSKALGGIVRVTFQMDNAGLSHEQLLRSIELIGRELAPMLKP